MPDPSLPFLTRPAPPKTVISLVPMIDVMLILLVFFMVTSTYLNLDMIPAVEQSDDPVPPTAQTQETSSAPLLIRLGADGLPSVRGQALTPEALEALVLERIGTDPALRLLILPSGAADMQALITVMDTATRLGVRDVSVVRLEALP